MHFEVRYQEALPFNTEYVKSNRLTSFSEHNLRICGVVADAGMAQL